MFILKLIELFLVVMFVLLIVTQIAIPASKERPIFPFFRKQRKLEDTIIELNQRKAEKLLQNEIKVKGSKNV